MESYIKKFEKKIKSIKYYCGSFKYLEKRKSVSGLSKILHHDSPFSMPMPHRKDYNKSSPGYGFA